MFKYILLFSLVSVNCFAGAGLVTGTLSPVNNTNGSGGGLTTNMPTLYYATNQGDFTIKSNSATGTGTLFLDPLQLIQFTAPGSGADLFYNINHSIESEFTFDSSGSLGFNAGFDAQAKADIQLGGSGHYHAPIIIQYDSSGLTNLAGWSAPLLFANINATTNHYFAFVSQAANTNTGEQELQIYPHWSDSSNYTFNGGQKDPLGTVMSGLFNRTNFVYNNAIIKTNLSVGSNTPPTSHTFGVYNSADAGETEALLWTTGNLIHLGTVSGTSGQNSQVFFNDRGGVNQFSLDAVNAKVFSLYNMSIGKTTPSFAMDVVGIINSSSNIQAGVAAGYVTLNTNQYVVATSGWTNTNSFDCTLYITSATAATFTYNDGTNNIFTDTGLTFTTAESFGMGPSYKVTVASGTITGVAIASH